MATNALPAIKHLRTLRHVFGENAEREKRLLLEQLRTVRLTTHAQVNALHEDLLFICAFPGASSTRALARRMLAGIGERLNRLASSQRRAAEDSGIAASATRHVFPYSIVQWLARTARDDLEIDWRNFDDPSRLDGFVGLLLCDAEREAFDGGEFTTREWIRLARRADARTDLEWLMKAASASPALASRLADEWDDAEVPLEWRLRDSRWSATHNRLAGVPASYRTQMRRPAADVIADVARPLESIERLSRSRARRVVAAARAALAARCREVNAMTYPNVDEIYWCDLGEGVALAVIGIARDQRLTLETNTGYLLFANGVPIGYGGVTPLFRQANTGINIFDPFRGAEAAYLWTQMLRAFHTLYGSRRFVINPYQFGAGNAEAIQSGAFWFYYRLGFRPAHAKTRTLAGTRGGAYGVRSPLPQRRAHAEGARHRRFGPRPARLRSERFLRRSVVAAGRRMRRAPVGEGGRLAARTGAATLGRRRRHGAWHHRSRPMAGARSARIRIPDAGRRESRRFARLE